MSDTARAGDDRDGAPAASTVVPAVGTALSAAILAALLLPVRRGADAPEIWLATAGAIAVTATFVGRRRGLLERRVAGPLAAGASLLVVCGSGYALTQGTLGSVVVPGLEASVPLLFVAFFAAMATVGVGVAEYAGLSGREVKRRVGLTLEMLILGALGLISLSVATIFVSLPVTIVAGEPTGIQSQVTEYLSFALGLGGLALGYLAFRERDLSFIDLKRPTLRTAGWVVVGFVLLIGANMGMSALMTALGIESSEHTTTQQVADNPDMLVVIVPSMLLLVGPFEELLYRNIIQKSLYERFSRAGSVVVSSVVFTSVHVLAYATAGPGELLASLSLVFVLGLVLGTIYERTENLLVPALVHGGYNAVIFVGMVV